MTFDELQELENLFGDIRHARDQLESRGYNVGGYTLNSITDAQRSMLPNEEDCEDYPKEEKKRTIKPISYEDWEKNYKI